MCRFVRDDTRDKDSSDLVGYHDLGLDKLDQVIEEAVPQWLGIWQQHGPANGTCFNTIECKILFTFDAVSHHIKAEQDVFVKRRCNRCNKVQIWQNLLVLHFDPTNIQGHVM